MNMKPVTVAFTVLISAAALAPLGAQNAGFQIGQNHPQNPVQGMTTPPIQGMTTPPILPLGGGLPTPAQPQRGNWPAIVNVLGPGEVIFVPAGTLVIESAPGQVSGAYLSAPSTPTARGSSTQLDRPSRTPAEDPKKPDAISRLEVGTPRDKVIEKYGNPIAFIMHMNGETLYFNAGVVVFVKDGVVATPGK